MKQDHILQTLLKNKQSVGLLLFFAENPNTELSYTELRNRTHLAKGTLTKWLSKLESQKIIILKRIGTTKMYKSNKENTFLKQFKILITISQLDFFSTLADQFNIKAYLFGSAARGENHEHSDIDILIIGKINKEELINQHQKYSKKDNYKVQFQIFTPLEWSALAEKDKAFYERVEKDKIPLQ